MPRVRRPLLALIVLVLALAIGYGIKAAQSGDSSPQPSSTSAGQTPDAGSLSSLPKQLAQTVALIKPPPAVASPLRRLRDLPDRPAGLAGSVAAMPHT